MLAQEGLELVRNRRDTNWLKRGSSFNWLTGDPIPDDNTNILHSANEYSYTIDPSGAIDESIDDINDVNAKLWLFDDFYRHISSGTSTPFSRLIRVLPNSTTDPDYITASSTVQWFDSGRVNTYVAETQLFNWR